VGQSATLGLSPTKVFVELFQVCDISVQEGATIQLVPPALQMIILPSGNVVPTGHTETKFDCHQGVGPIISPIILLIVFSYLC
jgi:hypothetical protein